jgi:hypothetical protein
MEPPSRSYFSRSPVSGGRVRLVLSPCEPHSAEGVPPNGWCVGRG